MKNVGKIVSVRSILPVALSVFALALLVPLAANAQVTVSHVRVTVGNAASTASYCDTATVCDLKIWTLPAGGVALGVGQTLVLTQTGPIINLAGQLVGGNFDTSDRVKSNS